MKYLARVAVLSILMEGKIAGMGQGRINGLVDFWIDGFVKT